MRRRIGYWIRLKKYSGNGSGRTQECLPESYEPMFKMRIAGVGSSIPERRVANDEIERRLGLEAGWIERRTGIRSRPIADRATATSDLAIDAGERALRQAGVNAAEVALLL